MLVLEKTATSESQNKEGVARDTLVSFLFYRVHPNSCLYVRSKKLLFHISA